MEFITIFEILHKQKIRYLLCGGLAVSIYGIPRTTADVDLLVDFERENVTKFINTLKVISYINSLPFSLELLIDDKVREEYINTKNLIAYSFFNSSKNTFLIDVLVKTPFAFSEMWERKEIRTINGIDINLISLNDLITMKEIAGRTQDKNDIALLSQLLKK